jgi:hypothetical protein
MSDAIPCSRDLPDIVCGGPWGQAVSDLSADRPLPERMAELERRYDQFIAIEEQC